uniref:Cobalt-precorrin 5A hydrolase n=1 Tax=Candidatus Kentrum sp. TUN TaxID=2126343 RepID=A0A450ZK32_9GAMM|nr:MAG: cobalt-precorrin 5A hydrolase [Candidatus Kentron sp. TUN]VFK54110.1 MAG: cobalt-precorrin 5A hydrolase [Candidatus Kentron sp. TUN]VFK55292.1 MAG: cobalt-precorrin 5A hydrolase [Candidatus Kentron sp. TUN]
MNTPRTLLIAITRFGAANAARLAARMPGTEILVAEHCAAACADLPNPVTTYTGSVKEPLAAAFASYRRLVCFISLGAVVRLAAPLLQSKETDPALVVVDDAARFAIAVLSGHLGGANDLAETVATLLGATPVVTTASEVGNTISVDILGRHLGWRVAADKATLTRTAGCVINGEPIALVQEAGSRQWWTRSTPLPDSIHCFDRLEAIDPSRFSAVLWITRRQLPDDWTERLADKLVIYRPPAEQEP